MTGLVFARLVRRRGSLAKCARDDVGCGYIRAKNVAEGCFEDLVAAGADAGERGRHFDVGHDADALGGAFVGVENADAADDGAKTSW